MVTIADTTVVILKLNKAIADSVMTHIVVVVVTTAVMIPTSIAIPPVLKENMQRPTWLLNQYNTPHSPQHPTSLSKPCLKPRPAALRSPQL